MKENVDQNISEKKKTVLKKNKTLIQNLKNKEFFNKSIFTPSELLLKKQNNHVALTKKKEPKIIEFLNTKDFTCQVDSNLPINTPFFEAIPPVIMFSDYEALNVKTAILKLRNRDQVARRVKIIQPETNLFRINPLYGNDNEQGNKIAPGLDLCFEIKFSPERKTDYKHDLIVVTEREKFVVPVIAIGKKPLIVFPDEINFGLSCPVKYYTEKPIIIHNQGEKTAKWEIKLPPNFEANKNEGILSEKCSEQIVMKFYPTERKFYQSFGQLMYDDDVAQFSLLGNAINGEVYLSKNYIQQEETYISLESRDTFKIVNKSNVKIDFEWRSFSSEKEENEKKNILLEQIKAEEDEKRQLIYETLELEDNINNYSQESDNEDVNLDEINEKEQILKKRKKAEMLLDRKYKAIRKAIEEDTLVFEDDIFDIQPVKGSIWPNSEMTITVIFKPKASLKYLQQAYCNISCSDQRLPLYMEGEGLGPKAFLSTNSLSISDIFVNDKQMFNIYIENKGEIPANFSLIKNHSTFSKMISFDIEKAQLEVGQRMNIIMTFQSSKVGEFQELFKWKLEGSSEVLSLLVRGHVQAPKFEFSRKQIDFQKVSYQFEKTEEIELSNTSTVPFSFELRIPHDGKGTLKEFEIVPNIDEIHPNETKKILIKFIPHYRKVYKCVMVLDIVGIGKDMKSIPIFAESEIPSVKILPELLDFGKIFLRYKQTKEIELSNESNLYARFVVHRLNPKYDSLGTISSDLDKGQIAPKSSIKINIHLTTTCIKTFEMDFVIEIVSDKNIQHLIKVRANSTGPDVELSRKEIDFGEIDVLKNYVQKVTLTNKSVIKADFFAFTKNKNSIFKPLQKRYILKPEESFDVEIVCYADDQNKFVDTLYFVIKEGVDKEVQLKAKAVGSTIFCKDISQISFGTVYTHKNYLQEVFLENKGRRVQNLRWQRKIEKVDENSAPNIYSIFPETVSLPPKTGLMFQFKAFSTVSGEQIENFILTSAVGTDRKQNTLYVSQLQGNFFKPALQFSEKHLEFKYVWNKNEEPSIMSQNLQITSKGPLPTSFSLHIEPPFEVFPKNFALLPGKQGIVKIDFNPRLNQNRFSNKISEKLYIKHNKHPKKETFDIVAEFCYPNLQLNETRVDFGAVMNNTSKKKYILMENTGIIDVEYEWFFIDDGSNYDIPINEVFDILPLRGKIEPGVTEKVEFYYYAVPKNSFSITGICKTIGGPQYQVEIGAEASDVAYEVVLQGNKEKKQIDLGEVYLNQKIQKFLDIENKSKVIFEYTVRLDTSGPRSQFMKKFLKIQPNKGVIKGTEKQRIKINMIPAFPQEICEYLVLQVAHFEPQKICIKGQGIFPSIRIDQPMQLDEKSNLFMEKKYRQITIEDYEEKNQLFQQMNNNQLIQMETFIIKNYIKENFEKLSNENTLNFTKSVSKKISSKNSLINVSTKQITSNQNLGKLKNSLHFMEEILLGTYNVNFGTIIAGQKAQKKIKITNIGKQPLSLDLDLATSKIPGLHLSFQKLHKLLPNNEQDLILTLKTKKNIKEAVIKHVLPLRVQNGGKYIIQLEYFITYPDLTLSEEIVDFTNVLVGTSKTMTIRLQNNKVIPCSWQVQSTVKNLPGKKKNQMRFFLNQNNGHLLENSQSNMEIRFEPKGPGIQEEIYEFTFKDSTVKMKFVCKGQGIIPDIQFEHDNIKFLPSLPNTVSFKPFSILNNSEFDLTLVLGSMNENVLKKIQHLQHLSQIQYLKPILSQAEDFWSDIEEESEINKKNKKINDEIAVLQESNEEDKQEKILLLKAQYQEFIPVKTRFPPVKFEQQVSLLILSDFDDIPKKVANFLQIEFKKQPVNLSELLQWNLNEKTLIGFEVEKLLAEKKEEYAVLMNPKNKKKNQPEISEKEFMFLEESKLQELLEERLKNQDCRAGTILYSIENQLQSVQKTLRIVQQYFENSNLIVLDVRKKPDETSSQVDLEKDSGQEGPQEGENDPPMEEGEDNDASHMQFRKIDLATAKEEEIENIVSKMFANKKLGIKQSFIIGNLKRVDEFSASEEIKNSNQQIRNHFKSQINPTNAEAQETSPQEKFPFQYIEVLFSNNLLKLNYKLMDLLPKPVFLNSGDLPLPEPIVEQVVRKTANAREFKFLPNIEILTYKDQKQHQEKIGAEGNQNPEYQGQAPEPEHEELTESNFLEYLEQGITTWHVPAKEKLHLCLKFYSQEIVKIQDQITFEYSNALWNEYHKGWTMGVETQTLYPEFSKNVVNIFSNRRKKAVNKKNVPYHKYYDMIQKKFNFGPILVRNDGEDNKLEPQQQESYLATLRITNISPFPINLSFELQPLTPVQEPKKDKKELKKQTVVQEERFILKEKKKEILPSETYNFQIEANPRKEECFQQNLQITVANNPEEFVVPIVYDSLYPSIELDQSQLIFEKLVLQKQSQKTFQIKNTSQCEINWSILNFMQLRDSNFEISPTSGSLKIGEQITVEITFLSKEEKKCEEKILFDISSKENTNIKSVSQYSIGLSAEGFKILVDFLGFTDPSKMILNFGETQVLKSVKRNFQMVNNGQYPIDLEMFFFKKNIEKYFDYEKNKIRLLPKGQKEVSLQFLALDEIKIDNQQKVFLSIKILEQESQDVFKEVKIEIKAMAQYSRFLINPQKQLNFGPVVFSEVRKRTFEIINNGIFDFDFDLYDFNQKQVLQEILQKYDTLLNPEENDKKKQPPKQHNKQKTLDLLQIEAYSITPSSGKIAPGKQVEIQVTFEGKENKWYEVKLGVEIFNRNRKESPELYFMLIGDSCIPSIENKKLRNIFEEQLVTQSLNSTGVNIQNIVHGNVFAQEENTFFFRNLIPSQYPEGINEKFKLINNGKVNVDLSIEIQKKGKSLFGFSVEPQKTTIAPHEFVYVKINFKPEIMAVYEGIFVAKVLHPAAKEKDNFVFNLKGEGILPTLQIYNEDIVEDKLDFGKVRSDRFSIKQVVVKNMGQIPATAIMRVFNTKQFRLISPPEKTIQPKEFYSFEIEFSCVKPGVFETQLELDTNLNPFEKNMLTLKGESFFEQICFEGIQNDILKFQDILMKPEVNKLGKQYFEMKNYSNQTIRYEWMEMPEHMKWIKIEPRIGHIAPNMFKRIKVTLYRPEVEKQYQINQVAQVKFQPIQVLLSSQPLKQRQWDSLKRQKKMVTKTEKDWIDKCAEIEKNFQIEFKKNKKAKKPQLPAMPQIPEDEKAVHQVLFFIQEPEFQVEEENPKTLSLQVEMKLDVPKIECSVDSIFFKPTKMFSNRIFNFLVKNSSCVRIEYEMEFFDKFSGSTEAGYYSVQPSSGFIDQLSSKDFIVKFSPLECEKSCLSRTLIFKVIGTSITHSIEISGVSERPICHFELPNLNSDNQEKIVEIQSIGYSNTNLKKFYILNPTSLGYDFNWTSDHSMNSYIKCLTPKGTIFPGKKFELIFEFTPTKNCPDKVEKIFSFNIPQHNITHQFLFQGILLQPKIFFSKAKIDFGALLLTGKGKETIIIKNLDDVSYHFNFSRQSIKGLVQSHYNSLEVTPLSGQLGPFQEIPINLTFLPKHETEYNYNLLCNIRNKKDPLTLNVKGIGYKLHNQLFLKKQLIRPNFSHEIDFKEIFVNETKQQILTLENRGEFNFDFTVYQKANSAIKITPESGTVRQNESLEIAIIFEPKQEIKLNSKMKLSIVSGPDYKFEVKGNAIYPDIVFKPQVIDFGSVLVTNNPIVVEKTIKIINNDQKALILDSNFVKNDHLDLKLAPSQSILPFNHNQQNILRIPVFLNLRKLGKIKEEIEFVIQNNYKVKVLIKGEGVPLQVELENPENINVNMGELKVNERNIKNINLINNSKVPVTLDFDVFDQIQKLMKFDIHFNSSQLHIASKSMSSLDIVFSPKQRIRNFSFPFQYKIKESSEHFELLSLKGACYGIDLKIIEENIDFREVVVNSQLSQKFHVVNLGDINTEYKWDLGFLNNYFQILPLEGVIQANQRIQFEAVFSPNSFNKYKCSAKLIVGNVENPLKLEMTGKGIETPPEAVQTVEFECPVRQLIVKKTTIKNDSDQDWHVLPKINFDNYSKGFFSIDGEIDIPARQSKEIEISYKPLTMHPEVQTATLFLPLKNGKAVLIKLIGRPLPPHIEQVFQVSFEAKKLSYHTISIPNWLPFTQRLKAKFSLENDQDPITKGIKINSAEMIDIQQGQHQNYKICLYALKAGQEKLKVAFTNVENKESILYQIDLVIKESQMLKEISFESNIREITKKVILLENSLPQDVVIEEKDVQLNSNNIFITSKFPLVLHANKDFGLEIGFRPLIILENQEVWMVINSQDLGSFKYKFILNSKKSNNIQNLNFKAKLGDSSLNNFTFVNFLNKTAPYQITIKGINDQGIQSQDIDFSVTQSTIQAYASSERSNNNFEIKFEPSFLGTSKNLMTVSNPEGGSYDVYLIGQSQMPLPKGPFKINQKGYPIEFKNPFSSSKEFQIKLENPSFTSNQKKMMKLDGKKTASINIQYKQSENPNGRLIVSLNEIQWVFYLQGVNEKK